MNCQESQQRLPGRVFDALPDDEMALLDQHLESCNDCQAQLEVVRARMALPGKWADTSPPSDLAARTIARLAQPDTPWWKRLARSFDDALSRFGAHSPTRVTGLATVAVTLLLLVPVLSPNWTRGRSSGAVTGCRANLRLLGKTLDRYAKDHQGHYPSRLVEMKPDYVRLFPECPKAGTDTYSSGYSPSADRLHYTLACRGEHHSDDGLPGDEPRFRR
jgi:hypothetical protein